MKSLIQSIRERYKTQSEAFPNMSAEASEMGATGVPGGNVTNQKDIVGDPAKQAMKKKKFDDAKAAANSTSSTPGAAEAQKKQGVAEGTYSKDVERAFPSGKASGIKTGASAPKGTSTMPKDKEKAKGKPAGAITEMDSEGYKGTRDDYELGKGKEHTGKPVTANKAKKDFAKILQKSIDKHNKAKQDTDKKVSQHQVKEGQDTLDAILRIIKK